MDRWLGAIEADKSSRTIEQKVVADKPADAHDRCTDGMTGNEFEQGFGIKRPVLRVLRGSV